ncbi:MAG: WYL domain-containing protein [Proteobacteria bacterium]|nr:WYL domain-containing protein [Pseudomonadota bacterium]
MAIKEKMAGDLKWATRQRFQYIELKAYYCGSVSRSDVAKAFGISDAAATKDLKLYGDLAPDNLIYSQRVFGFVPTDQFSEQFADLSPENALPLIADNLATAGGPYGNEPIYGMKIDSLPLPARFPGKAVLAQLMRAISARKKLKVVYRSLSGRDSGSERIIEPHALASTGLRWHVRAYNEDTYDFRDFVLSRFEQAQLTDEDAESSADYDDDWVEQVAVKLAPHPGLSDKQRLGLVVDYDIKDVIELRVRRALVGYLLQRLDVDTTPDHSLNPNKHQLILTNRDEIEQFAAWAFSQ